VRVTGLDAAARPFVTLVVVGLAIGLTAYLAGFTGPPRPVRDIDAYWNAAVRLRTGAPLYPVLTYSGAETTYRYAPWFAALWVPLTLLPQHIVYAVWKVVLCLASAAAVWPLLRTRRRSAVLLALVFIPYLGAAVGQGNVQPLMIAALAWSVGRKWGPPAIGIAASLKLFPILYVVLMLARREWRQAGTSVVVAAVLILPAALFG
jgi:alpha-1,2-mannosyltransferase